MSKDTIIWRYHLDITESQSFQVPFDTEPLCVQLQTITPCLWIKKPWIEEDPSQRDTITIHTLGTGIPFDETGMKYIGTYQTRCDVWHVFWKISRNFYNKSEAIK
jgi:hypothetical protein